MTRTSTEIQMENYTRIDFGNVVRELPSLSELYVDVYVSCLFTKNVARYEISYSGNLDQTLHRTDDEFI